MKQALPLSTRLLMSMSEITRAIGLPVLRVILLAGFCARIILRRPAQQLRWHQAKLRLPLIGRIVLNLHLARYARTLSILTNSAVPLLEG
ncbi:type II secretion system protein GspF, partial [Erwinia amylovora]|nr:type II secretion system protein GspF [Erwinia amylovora]